MRAGCFDFTLSWSESKRCNTLTSDCRKREKQREILFVLHLNQSQKWVEKLPMSLYVIYTEVYQRSWLSDSAQSK